MLTSIAGRVAIVTGGRSGIGRGIAEVFARQGAKLLVVARDAAGADMAAMPASFPESLAALA